MDKPSPGTKIRAIATNSDCWQEGETFEVGADSLGDLFIYCHAHGGTRHYLDGQYSDFEVYHDPRHNLSTGT